MAEFPSPNELNTAKQLLQGEPYGEKAIATLEQRRDFSEAFYDLWTEQNGPPPTMGDRASIWQITLKRIRQEICGDDDSFRTKVKEYKKSPTSATLLTGLIFSLVSMAGLPIDPTIATLIVLYILHVGLDVFCEYTAPDKEALPPGPPSLPPQ